MINLGRGAGHADLHIVFCAQLQETFQTGRGVFRALPFIAMGQQHGKTTQAAPLGFPGGDKLVDHHLGAIGEIAELRFPNHQGLGRGGGITVLVPQHSFFGQQRIVNVEAWLLVIEMLQRHILLTVFLVMQNRMAVGESATAGILPGQANMKALINQGGVGQGFPIAPVQRQRTGSHFAAVFKDLFHLPLYHKAFRRCFQTGGQILQLLQRIAGIPVIFHLVADIG